MTRTCVIGAGVAGLTAGKRLNDYGVDYQCFESSDRIGGNWAFRNPNGHSSAYNSLHIDTSKDRRSLLDFPISRDYPDFPHHSQIKEYLEEYAAEFDLKRAITFNTSVQQAEPDQGGGWQISTSDGVTSHFDFLVVANGHHWDPRFPSFPGEFDGVSLHSHSYVAPNEPLDFYGKRILVVGIGNSAADIICELSRKGVADRVVVSTRSGAWVVPKYAFGRPGDSLFKTNVHVPLRWQRKVATALPLLLSGRMERYGLPTPDHGFLEAHPTVSSELLLRLSSGDVHVKPDVSRFDASRATFVDGTSEEFDIVIYATGYNITFPFFEPETISAPDNRIRLYKRMFVPGRADVAFIGFAQAVPTLFPFVELQSDLLGRYLAGEYVLPSQEEMERVIDADQHKYIGHYSERPRHTQQVDYFMYEHQLRTEEIPHGRRRADSGAFATVRP